MQYKKFCLIILIMVSILQLTAFAASATSLSIVGTAIYEGANYNMIYEVDNNGSGLIWFDYTNELAFQGLTHDYWLDQNNWAAGLNTVGTLSYYIDPKLDIAWEGDWRLPSAGSNPDEGYSQTTSEMGYLYYEELNNLAGGPLSNTGLFQNLEESIYYNGTVDFMAWTFYLADGSQFLDDQFHNHRAIAVRSASVTVVPESNLFGLLTILVALVFTLNGSRFRIRQCEI